MSNLVAVILGSASQTAIEKIKGKNDNYRFTSFEDLSEAIEASVTHDTLFKRIVIYEKCLADASGLIHDEDDMRVQALQALDQYINDGRQETEVVLVCNTNEPTNIHKYFMDVLDNPSATPVLPEKTTIPLISEFVASPIVELRSKFYELDKKGVQTKVAAQLEEVDAKPKKQTQTKKKSGLFGLFGGKKAESKETTSNSASSDRSSRTDFSDTTRARESAERLAKAQGYDAGSYDQAMSQEYGGYNTGEDSGEFDGPAGDMGLESDNGGFGDDNYSSGGFGDSNSGGFDDQDSGIDGLLSFAEDGRDHSQTGFLDEDEDEEDNDWAGQDSSDAWGETTDGSSWDEDEEPTGFVGEDSGELEDEAPYDDMGQSSGDNWSDEGPSGFYAPVGNFSQEYEEPAPTQSIPRVEIERAWAETPEYDSYESYDSAPQYDAAPEYDAPEVDRKPEVLDRIVVVTGDRGTGVTTEAATLAYTAASEGKTKVLLIDLDFEKAGVVGMLDNMTKFLEGDHGITSGNPYKEGPLDVLSNGYDGDHTPEDINWVVDSRNYAEYSKIVIDCPIDNINLLEELLGHTGIVVMMPGTPVGIVNTVRRLNNNFVVSDEVAKILDKRGKFYPIRESDDFEEVVGTLKNTFVFDRVNWLSKVA